MLTLKNISKSFDNGDTYAVRDVSLTVMEGETMVLLGSSGCGKTTTLKMINRLVEPTEGEISIDGVNVLERDPVELRREIGYVFQGIGLFPHMTVAENVAILDRLRGMGKKKRMDAAHDLLRLVELDPDQFGPRYPAELSGGQQQRVGIGRSLVVEPDLWFLDEPFSALDPLIRREMQDEFIRLQNMLRKTIVFITHDFDEAIRLADRIAVMKDGMIEQIATPEELVQNPATDYVADFTRHVARAKVIRAQSRMEPATAERFAGEVPNDATIEAIAEKVERADAPLKVMRDGQVIGQITARSVIDVLVGRG